MRKASEVDVQLFKSALGLDFVQIPKGKFIMGSDSHGPNEKPAHEVLMTEEDIFISTTEVTQEVWEAIMGSNPSHDKSNKKNPVENISWFDVQEFIKKANEKFGEACKFRLPTEAEWEYAARATTDKDFCYNCNDELPIHDYAVIGSSTAPVASRLPNLWYMYDVHGNVWEWCLDEYKEDAYKGRVLPVSPYIGEPSLKTSVSMEEWNELVKTGVLTPIDIDHRYLCPMFISKYHRKTVADKSMYWRLHDMISRNMNGISFSLPNDITTFSYEAKVALSTEPSDRPRAEAAMTKLYEMMEFEAPKFIWVQSPTEATKELNKITGENKPFYREFMFGSGEIEWYKDNSDLTPQEAEEFALRKEIAESTFWWWPLKGVCVCCERPKTFRIANGRVCRTEGGPAIEFRDGTGIYLIRNFLVPEDVVMTPAESFPLDRFARETDVDLRSQILFKVGFERLLPLMKAVKIHEADLVSNQAILEETPNGTTLKGYEEKTHHYELYEVEVIPDRKDKALKMESASIPGLYHIEFVGPECVTVAQAHEYRYGRKGFPTQLT